MKAVVFHGVGDVRLDDVPEPQLQEPTDAVVRITSCAICGTDLHLIRGTVPGMKPGTILGHEGVGVVDRVGVDVRNFKPGDRVVIPSTIACGYCSYCRDGYYSQCDHANPGGKRAGTAFYGGPVQSGAFHGLQAEKARVPFASTGLVRLPSEVKDDDAIMLSDIFPTGYFGAVLAEIEPGDAIAVFGCGPVGQFVIASAKHLGAGRIFAVDTIATRLAAAKAQGAEVIDFNAENPVDAILRLTGGIGVDRAIDAVGVDAVHPSRGPDATTLTAEFERELSYVAPETNPKGDHWRPGNAPTEALRWAVDALAKAGTLSVIGVYPETLMVFPIGKAMNRNLTLKMGNCNHRKYIPHLLELVRTGAFHPSRVITQYSVFETIIDAYHAFDARQQDWIKVAVSMIKPSAKKAA